jgi:hypothetical protein
MRAAPKQDLHVEPTLHEALDDPVIQALMRRDGVTRDEVVNLAVAARARMRAADTVIALFPTRPAASSTPVLRPQPRRPFRVRPDVR